MQIYEVLSLFTNILILLTIIKYSLVEESCSSNLGNTKIFSEFSAGDILSKMRASCLLKIFIKFAKSFSYNENFSRF